MVEQRMIRWLKYSLLPQNKFLIKNIFNSALYPVRQGDTTSGHVSLFKCYYMRWLQEASACKVIDRIRKRKMQRNDVLNLKVAELLNTALMRLAVIYKPF